MGDLASSVAPSYAKWPRKAMPSAYRVPWCSRPSCSKSCPAWDAWCPELNEENVRELSLYSYRILYEVKAIHIDIQSSINGRICRGDSAWVIALFQVH